MNMKMESSGMTFCYIYTYRRVATSIVDENSKSFDVTQNKQLEKIISVLR